MASPALGGPTRVGRVVGPALDKIVKNAAWRKHSALVAACKSALDLLDSSSPAAATDDASSPLPGLSAADADAALRSLVLALDAAAPKLADPALDCTHKLLSHHLLRAEIHHDADDAASRLFSSVCGCGGMADEAAELGMLRVLVAAARSPTVVIRGEALVQAVKSCYNVYLGSAGGLNQLCAKAALAQILTIIYARVEADAMEVKVQTVSIVDMLDLSDRSLHEATVVQAAQNFINEAMEGSQLAEDPPPFKDDALAVSGAETGDGEAKGSAMSKIREDGFLLFKNLCKFSMKFATPDNPEDPLLMRGKVLSLEMLKMVVDNAGPIWRMNEK